MHFTYAPGIPFLTQQEEDRLRTSIEDRHQKMGRENTKETFNDIPIPDDMKLNLTNNMYVHLHSSYLVLLLIESSLMLSPLNILTGRKLKNF